MGERTAWTITGPSPPSGRLRLGGALLFEVGLGQAPAVEDILAQNGYQDIQSAQDTQGIWRVVEGTARD